MNMRTIIPVPCDQTRWPRGAAAGGANVSTIMVNGSPADLPDDPRVSLLDFLREHCTSSAPRRDAIRAPAAPARCSWTASGSCPAWLWRSSTRAERSLRSRGSTPTARCTRCSRHSSSMTASNAATARQVRSAPRSAWCRSSSAASPATSPTIWPPRPIAQLTARPRGAARAHERQSVPLRRLQRHRRGDRANLSRREAGAMTPFTLFPAGAIPWTLRTPAPRARCASTWAGARTSST